MLQSASAPLRSKHEATSTSRLCSSAFSMKNVIIILSVFTLLFLGFSIVRGQSLLEGTVFINEKEVTLTARNYQGEACWNKYVTDKGETFEEIEVSVYNAMGGVNGSVLNPTGEGYILSFCGSKYDTANGQLNVGDYEDLGDFIYVNTGGKVEEAIISISKELIQ